MLADEVTHVKMGSDWLRRLTADDPERRARALEFQRVVDKLFSLGGVRGEDEDSPIKLARRFRELAGFDDDEIDEIADLSHEAREELVAREQRPRLVGDLRWPPSPPRRSPWCSSTTAIVEAVDAVAAAGRAARRRGVRVEVDEPTRWPATHCCRVDPVELAVDGGAFEDPRHPRQLDIDSVAVVVGRLVLQALDRRDPAFGEPPPDDALSVAHRVAWDVYALGRLDRLGYPRPAPAPPVQLPQPPRLHRRGRRRLRALWTGDGLTWAEIERLSDDARAVAAST